MQEISADRKILQQHQEIHRNSVPFRGNISKVCGNILKCRCRSANVAAVFQNAAVIFGKLPQDIRSRLIFPQLTATWLNAAAFSSEGKPVSKSSTATSAYLERARRELRQSPWLYGRVLRDSSEMTQVCGNVAGAGATPGGGETLPGGLAGMSRAPSCRSRMFRRIWNDAWRSVPSRGVPTRKRAG
ncbi:MAG TPA: hypothetical protein VF173_29850 [Thermoanaerobaculia bacterium]|nr:hypothetical protein [Thermoanaerobaculia bacterium]